MATIKTTEYEFIYMRQLPKPAKRKTFIWTVYNKRSNATLGEISWYPPWRQYAYLPTGFTVYSAGCLADIQHFIEQLKEKHE